MCACRYIIRNVHVLNKELFQGKIVRKSHIVLSAV